ncbi:MAG: hypothetical protein KC547_11225 [Anaerolineae bacterium]|nr:hypothetical protein [Anaerolineae bacterium]MCA9910219.1 hypothetical protein [Anaerolineae bacterium]
MRRLLLGLVLILALIVPHATAQDEQAWWEDGCDPRALALIEPTAQGVDYAGACALYRTCDPTGDGSFVCQMRAFDYLRAPCAPGDTLCEKTAMLYAAALLAFDMPGGESTSFVPPDTVIEGVPRALAAVQAGDYAAALAAYQLTPPNTPFGDSALPISRAVVFELLGDMDAALDEYNSVFDVWFTQPLAWYGRAQLYGRLGRLDEASWDALALAEYLYNTPELIPLVDELTAQYPVDSSKISDWVLYPISGGGSGVVGEFTADATLEPPFSVRLGLYDDPAAIIVVGVSTLLDYDEDAPRLVQVIPRVGAGLYRLEYPAFWDNSGRMTLDLAPGLISGSESITYFEGASRRSFLIAPVDAPNPRSAWDALRVCPGAAVSKVQVGTEISTSYFGDPILPAAEAPGGELALEVGAGVIVEGPACVGSAAWWRVADESGRSGWVPEIYNNAYLMNIRRGGVSTFICPAAPLPRLQVGTDARVLPGLGANNLREEPIADAARVGSIPEGEIFHVIGGPICRSGHVWWQVEYQGVSGWTAEGEGGAYWLAPVG